MNTRVPVTYRSATPEDLPFIYSTWLKSYRNTEWARCMSNDTFFFHHKAILKSILEGKTAQITLICSEDDPDQLYGYCVADVVGPVSLVHFIYVKYNFRKLGLAKELIKHLGYWDGPGTKFITHLPRAYMSIKDKYKLEYNPYLLPGDY